MLNRGGQLPVIIGPPADQSGFGLSVVVAVDEIDGRADGREYVVRGNHFLIGCQFVGDISAEDDKLGILLVDLPAQLFQIFR